MMMVAVAVVNTLLVISPLINRPHPHPSYCSLLLMTFFSLIGPTILLSFVLSQCSLLRWYVSILLVRVLIRSSLPYQDAHALDFDARELLVPVYHEAVDETLKVTEGLPLAVVLAQASSTPLPSSPLYVKNLKLSRPMLPLLFMRMLL